MLFYFLSGIALNENDTRSADDRLKLPRALLLDKIFQLLNCWFETVLSRQETQAVESGFFHFLAVELCGDDYREFRRIYSDLSAQGEWIDIIGE